VPFADSCIAVMSLVPGTCISFHNAVSSSALTHVTECTAPLTLSLYDIGKTGQNPAGMGEWPLL